MTRKEGFKLWHRQRRKMQHSTVHGFLMRPLFIWMGLITNRMFAFGHENIHTTFMKGVAMEGKWPFE
jgi:hypothetical protein